MKDKFPIKILISNHQKGRFKVTTSIDNISKSNINIRQELAYLESDYSVLMKTIQDTIAFSSKGKKTDPRLYWLIGEYINRFLERIDDMGYYLIKQNSTIARDIGVSESSIKKIVSFRNRFSKLSMVNPTIPWVKYRNNKVPVEK